MIPRVDGAMIMYDAVNEETTREVPPIMGECCTISLPLAAVPTRRTKARARILLHTQSGMDT